MDNDLVIKIQRIFRRFLERKKATMRAFEDSDSETSIEEINLATKTSAKEENPKSKEDFQRLYAELESWRLQQEKKISENVKPGFHQRQSRAKLVSMEGVKLADLAANRDRHKLAAKQDVVKNVIMKAGQPRMWVSSTGRMLQLETPGTRRAKEFFDIFQLLSSDEGVDGEDRLPALHAVAEMVGGLNQCPLGDELLSLVIREEELVNRNVRGFNLENLRKRIISKYLQLIRSPDHNPEILRFEKQLPVPILFSSRPIGSVKGGTEFCLGCRKHLSRKMFSLSTVSSIGRCINCEQLDNDARSRLDLSVYKVMMDRIKRGEESRDNTTSPIFQLQDSDIRHIVRSFWDSRSILSGKTDLYELRLVRYYKDEEWSPWNCILLTHHEAEIHSQLGNLYKSYGHLLVQKIRHKHTLARNHFSKMSTMAKYFSDNNGNGHNIEVILDGKSMKLHTAK